MAWLGSYPTSAAAMAAAVGYGTWTSAWLFNESSGNLSSTFGTPATLTKNGTGQTYGVAGPVGGDTGITFTSSGAQFYAGGDTQDVVSTDDFALFLVMKLTAGSAATGSLAGKHDGGTGWYVYRTASTTTISIDLNDNIGNFYSAALTGVTRDVWWAIGIVLDRSTGKLRMGRIDETGTASVITEVSASPLSTMANAVDFAFGKVASVTLQSTDMTIAGAYWARGSGACTGMSANLSTALTNFRNQLVTAAATSTSGNLLLLGVG